MFVRTSALVQNWIVENNCVPGPQVGLTSWVVALESAQPELYIVVNDY